MSQDLARSCSVGAVSDAMTLSRLFPTPQMSPDYSQQRLVMFAVPQPPHPLTALQSEEWSDRLMTALVGRLPGHMVPDVIVPVLYLPFNRHGTYCKTHHTKINSGCQSDEFLIQLLKMGKSCFQKHTLKAPLNLNK